MGAGASCAEDALAPAGSGKVVDCLVILIFGTLKNAESLFELLLEGFL